MPDFAALSKSSRAPAAPNFPAPPANDKRNYVLSNHRPGVILQLMNKKSDPIIGNWYRHLDKGQMFQVTAFDEDEALVELQHFDGDLEEVTLSIWRSMDLETAEAPEDWTGPMDDIEQDDLGYSETAMSDSDWRRPLQETSAEQSEDWENTGSEEETAGQDEKQLAEELWEPEKIEAVARESSA